MDNESDEPSPAPLARPCSTPHSAPVGWLSSDSPRDQAEPQPTDAQAAFEASLDLYAGDAKARCDGWTPFARRLFLQVMAETGRVSLACEYCGLTKQSAYALRARDPMFALGWDAACELARPALADALYEKALDGVTDTITRDGAVVATRHRFDSRLSIAVLHRLDKRCDRAAEYGSRHLALVRHWDQWLGLVSKGEEESANLGQLGQLPESANPTSESEEDEGLDLSDRCWRDPIDDIWMTDFPPPPGFDGYENRPYGQDDEEVYQRACTAEEVAILEADRAADAAAERAEDEELRDEWFAVLRAASSAKSRAEPGT